MKLTISERLILLEMLPKEGDYASLKECHKAKLILGFTNEEIKAYGITQADNQVKWTTAGNSYMADLPLSEWITTTIQDALRKKNKDKKLQEREYALYEKFIVAYDQV